MIRKIIQINEEKCNGCGACANACHEGAIQMIGGKAKLIRDDYCDGLGDCLPACPMDAITFVEREADAYDDAAVKAHLKSKGGDALRRHLEAQKHAKERLASEAPLFMESQLSQWPIQIKLAPVNAPYFDGADLLIAADCTAYAYGNFHNDFIKDHITLIGCPKLDAVNYSEKLTEIFSGNNIRSITVTRMQVPCCGGLQYAVEQAVKASGREIPVRIVTIGIKGNIL